MKLRKILTNSVIATLTASILIAAAFGLSATSAALSSTPAVTATVCDTLTEPVNSSFNSTQAQYLTLDASTKPADFTTDGGTPFAAAEQSASGLILLTRLYRPASGDYFLTRWASEVSSAVALYGYVDQGVAFYALPSASGCGIPVYRYQRGPMHRQVTSQSDRDSLTAAGWNYEGISFYAAAAPETDTVFSIAVMPDTQNEVYASSNDRFRQRSQWLADNRESLDLRYVLHTGDVVNWGHVDPAQFTRAQIALAPLSNANIPYVLTVGNHDTAAVCQGGSACPGANTSVTVRDTSAFNNAFPLSSLPNVGGTYEPNKVENNYVTFNAGGKKWLILTLELWARTPVISWAASVVSSHPDYNVVIQTHSYLNADGSISTSNGGYGANSPMYLYNNLVSLYPNIKIVLSGHVGTSASRTDTGVNGNKIASFLQGFHSTSNPVRLIEIDTITGGLTTRIYAPQDGAYWTQYDLTVTGLTFVQ